MLHEPSLLALAPTSLLQLRDRASGLVTPGDDKDDPRTFWGLKFLILEFFWIGRFGKYFLGWPDLSRDFFGYSEQSEDLWYCLCTPATLFCDSSTTKLVFLSGDFQGSETQHEIFGGLIFGPGIFLGLLKALGTFLGFDFWPHSIIPVT